MDKYSYIAFISYKREDEKWAKWLQHKLEHYRLPSSIRKENNSLPKAVRPVFRDKSELASGVLKKSLYDALRRSKYLIVVCSPNSAKSEWVNKEVQFFIDEGKKDFIIPFIVDGTPHSLDKSLECYPHAIRHLPQDEELLGVSVKDGRSESAIKIIAQMLNLQFDTLWQRYQREIIMKRTITICASLFVIIASILVAQYTKKRNYESAGLKVIQASEIAESLIADGDCYLARRVLIDALPKDALKLDRQYVAKAESILRRASSSRNAILRGHDSYINSVNFSNTGNFIVTASSDSTIRIWDVLSGYEKVLKDAAPVTYASFSPDEEYIISGTRDSIIRFWSIRDGLVMNELVGHTQGITSVCYSTDGEMYLSSSADSTARIWYKNGKCTLLLGHNNCVNHATFNPFCNEVATASSDSTVRIWDVNTGTCKNVLRSFNGEVWRISYSPNGRYLATASKERTIRIFDTNSWKCLKMIETGANDSYSVVFNTNNDRILVTLPSSVKEFDFDGNELKNFTGHRRTITAADYSPDNKRIASVSYDKTIRLWDIVNEPEKAIFQPIYRHHDEVTDVDFRRDGKRIASSSLDGTFKIWNVETGYLDYSCKSINKAISAINYSPKGDRLLLLVQPILMSTDEQGGDEVVFEGHKYPIIQEQYSPNGEKVASVSWDNSIKIWDSSTGHCSYTISPSIGILTSCSFDYTGKRIVFSSVSETLPESSSIFVKDLASGKEKSIKVYDSINCVLFSHDSQTIIAAGVNSLWRINFKTSEVYELGENKNISRIGNVILTPDGNCIVYVDSKEFGMIDIQTGQSIFTMPIEGVEVSSLCFSPDSKTIVAGLNFKYHWCVGTIGFTSFQELIDNERSLFSLFNHNGRWISEKEIVLFHING